MTIPDQHPYWVVVDHRSDQHTYSAYPLQLDENTGTFTVSYRERCTTITALTESGARLILEVDDVSAMTNPRVLYNADGGSSGIVHDERTAT